MSELRSAIEPYELADVAGLPAARIEEEYEELERAGERIEAQKLRRLAELDRQGAYARDGHLSTASWLMSTCKLGWGKAREIVRTARALEQMPRTREALKANEISLSAVTLLARVREADPELFARDEEVLLEAARTHSIADLQKVAAYWRQRVERERDEESPDAVNERRSLHASVTIGRMVRVDGDLDPETGESLLTALRAVLDAEARTRTDEDRRTPGQRRADALGEVCRGWLDRSERPSVAGERPHVTLTVGVETLQVLMAPSSSITPVPCPRSLRDGSFATPRSGGSCCRADRSRLTWDAEPPSCHRRCAEW